MRNLKITLVQTELHWEDIDSNIEMFNKIFHDLDKKTNLVVLPEMFTTGFSMNAELLAQDMDGSTVKWMLESARKIDAAILGSIIVRENIKKPGPKGPALKTPIRGFNECQTV